MILKSHDQKQLDRTSSSGALLEFIGDGVRPHASVYPCPGLACICSLAAGFRGCRAGTCGGCPAVTFECRHLGLGSTYGGQQVAYERPRFVIGRAARREWSAQQASRACSGCQQKSGRRSEGLQLSHRYPANDGSVETGTEAHEGAAPMRSIYEPPAAGEPAGQPPYSSGSGADDPYRRDSSDDPPRRGGVDDPYGGGNQGAGGGYGGGPYGQGPYGKDPMARDPGREPTARAHPAKTRTAKARTAKARTVRAHTARDPMVTAGQPAPAAPTATAMAGADPRVRAVRSGGSAAVRPSSRWRSRPV